MRLTALIFTSTIATLAAPAAANGMISNDFSAEVAHEDIDLTTRQGVARLDERLKTIIRQKCANGGRDSQSRRLERQCRESAIASTEKQVRFAVLEAKARQVRLAQGTPVAPQG